MWSYFFPLNTRKNVKRPNKKVACKRAMLTENYWRLVERESV